LVCYLIFKQNNLQKYFKYNIYFHKIFSFYNLESVFFCCYFLTKFSRSLVTFVIILFPRSWLVLFPLTHAQCQGLFDMTAKTRQKYVSELICIQIFALYVAVLNAGWEMGNNICKSLHAPCYGWQYAGTQCVRAKADGPQRINIQKYI